MKKLFCIISPNIRSEIGKQGSAKVYSADFYRNCSYFPKYAQNVSKRTFCNDLGNIVGRFHRFLNIFPKNADEEFYDKKKKTTPVTTVLDQLANCHSVPLRYLVPLA